MRGIDLRASRRSAEAQPSQQDRLRLTVVPSWVPARRHRLGPQRRDVAQALWVEVVRAVVRVDPQARSTVLVGQRAPGHRHKRKIRKRERAIPVGLDLWLTGRQDLTPVTPIIPEVERVLEPLALLQDPTRSELRVILDVGPDIVVLVLEGKTKQALRVGQLEAVQMGEIPSAEREVDGHRKLAERVMTCGEELSSWRRVELRAMAGDKLDLDQDAHRLSPSGASRRPEYDRRCVVLDVTCSRLRGMVAHMSHDIDDSHRCVESNAYMTDARQTPSEQLLVRDAHELGEAIRHLRRARGWTQADLARIAGVSRPALIRLERGESVRVSTLMDVLTFLGARLRVERR